MKKLLLIVFAAVLAVAFCAPAMAATKKVSFYGDIRFNTYWVKKSEDLYNNGQGDTDSDLLWQKDPWDSRFGARFAEGPISANVEIRPVRDNESSTYWRQWWAQWDLGPAQLLVGYTYTAACVAFDMSQFDSESGVGYGDFMSRLRTQQIRLTIPFSMGKFTIAGQDLPLIQPEYTSAPGFPIDTDQTLPQFEACLTLNFSPVVLDIFGGYGTFDIVNMNTEDSESVGSSIYGIKASLPFGPLYIKGMYVGGTNTGNYGELTSAAGRTALKYRNMLYNPVTGETTDSSYTTYGGVVGYKVSDMVTAEVGYFQQKTERYLQEEDTNSTYYVVLNITPIKGVNIYPEIGVRDEDDTTDAVGNTTDEGKRTYFGAYWKISF